MDILLFGATGMVGDGVLRWLIASPKVSRIVTVSRKPLAVQHPKLEAVIEPDMFHLQLGKSRRVEEKKMFGGIAFMVEGKMCVTVSKGRIMCRIDPAAHDAALERKDCTTVVMKGREYRGYVHIDVEALNTKADLDYWVKLALDFNGRAKASTRKRQ